MVVPLCFLLHISVFDEGHKHVVKNNIFSSIACNAPHMTVYCRPNKAMIDVCHIEDKDWYNTNTKTKIRGLNVCFVEVGAEMCVWNITWPHNSPLTLLGSRGLGLLLHLLSWLQQWQWCSVTQTLEKTQFQQTRKRIGSKMRYQIPIVCTLVCRASNSWGNIRHVSGAFTSSCKCLTCNTNNESSEGISKASDAWWCSVMMLLLLVLFFFCALVLARQNGVFADQHVFAVISRYFLLWQPFFRSATSTNDLYCETDIHKAPKC